MKKLLILSLVIPFLLLGQTVNAAPITYYDLDFEDGTFGGGVTFPGFGTPSIVSPSLLDGKGLQFDLGDQMTWALNDVDSMTHYVAFDYIAGIGANVTQFLDVPSILRLDVSEPGTHSVEVYYDYSTKMADAYLDGSLNSSLLTILAWPTTPSSSMIRIANQAAGPGNSTNVFQIDNLLWQGNVTRPVPEPASLLLLGSGLVGLGLLRRRFKISD